MRGRKATRERLAMRGRLAHHTTSSGLRMMSASDRQFWRHKEHYQDFRYD